MQALKAMQVQGAIEATQAEEETSFREYQAPEAALQINQT